MVRDPFGSEDAPDLQPVLAALGDPDCRRIVRLLDEFTTASQLSDRCDVPSSTASRKFEVSITRPAASAERRLAGTWSEVRKET